MTMRYHQRGLGFAGWLIMILVFGFVITIAAKLTPIYMDHNTMTKVLDKMGEESGLAGKYTDDLRDMVVQRFKLNNIRDFDVKKNLQVVRDKNSTQLILDYEVRTPLISNVDLVASFNKSIQLRE